MDPQTFNKRWAGGTHCHTCWRHALLAAAETSDTLASVFAAEMQLRAPLVQAEAEAAHARQQAGLPIANTLQFEMRGGVNGSPIYFPSPAAPPRRPLARPEGAPPEEVDLVSPPSAPPALPPPPSSRIRREHHPTSTPTAAAPPPSSSLQHRRRPRTRRCCPNFAHHLNSSLHGIALPQHSPAATCVACCPPPPPSPVGARCCYGTS